MNGDSQHSEEKNQSKNLEQIELEKELIELEIKKGEYSFRRSLAIFFIVTVGLFWIACVGGMVLGLSRWEDVKDPFLIVNNIVSGLLGLIFAYYYKGGK